MLVEGNVVAGGVYQASKYIGGMVTIIWNWVTVTENQV